MPEQSLLRCPLCAEDLSGLVTLNHRGASDATTPKRIAPQLQPRAIALSHSPVLAGPPALLLRGQAQPTWRGRGRGRGPADVTMILALGADLPRAAGPHLGTHQ